MKHRKSASTKAVRKAHYDEMVSVLRNVRRMSDEDMADRISALNFYRYDPGPKTRDEIVADLAIALARYAAGIG